MKKIIKLITILLLMVAVMLPTESVQARDTAGRSLDGRVIFGNNFTLESGDTLTGDLIVFGGSVTVEEDAIIEGDVVIFGGNVKLEDNPSEGVDTIAGALVVFGGNVTIGKNTTIGSEVVVLGGDVSLDGTVNGELVIIGGSTNMGEAAVVEGDLVTIGGTVNRDPGSEVKGDVVTNIPAPDIFIPDLQVPDVPNRPIVEFNSNPFGRVLRILGTTILFTLLAMLASLFLQPQIGRVSQAVVGQPVIAGSIGLLTVVLAPIVLGISALTIILIPVVVLAAGVLALSWLFGLIAIGTEVGGRFTQAINQIWAPPFTAGMGTFLMMLVLGGVGMVPCIGWLISFLVGMLGIGGVVLTIFGSRLYPRVAMPIVSSGADSTK